MSLDKKGFAEVIDSAINECKNISSVNKNLVLNENVSSDSVEYKYNKCIEKAFVKPKVFCRLTQSKKRIPTHSFSKFFDYF